MIKHVVWDWNGTLVNDVDLCVDILNHVLLAFEKKSTTVEDYRKSFIFPVAKFYQLLGLPSFGPMYDRLAEDYIQEYRDRFQECSLHYGALKMLKELSSLGITQSILSAGKQSDLERFTTFHEINQWMIKIDGANNVEARGKEDRVVAHFCCLGHDPEEVLFVGDTLHDWEIAKLVNCKVLLFVKGHTDQKRLVKASVPIINCLSEIGLWVSD